MAATRIDCDIHPAAGGTRASQLPASRAIDALDLTSYPPRSGPYVAGTFPVRIEDSYVIVGT